MNVYVNFSKLCRASIDSRNIEEKIKIFITFSIHYRISRFLTALNIYSTFFDINLKSIFTSPLDNLTRN